MHIKEIYKQQFLYAICYNFFLIINLFSILTVDKGRILQKIPEICERIIPLELNTLDKKEKSNNISAIRRAHSHLTDGGALVIFPGGEVSSSSGIFNTPVDSKWSSLPVKLSKSFNCPILPVYIHGRSSYLFQLVTKISFSLRKYFLFREVLKNRNKTINVTINDLHNLNDYNSKFNDVDLSGAYPGIYLADRVGDN